jgi:hypothetical protein
VRDYAGLAERDRDFGGHPRDWTIRGALGADAKGAWLPKVEFKP